MTVPVINAFINFSTGPSFAQAMILGSGILDTNILGDSASIIVDVSNQVNRIETNRGRTALSDLFQTGSLTLRIIDQNGDFNPQNVSGPYYNWFSWISETFLVVGNQELKIIMFGDVNDGIVDNFLYRNDIYNYTTFI